MTKDPSIEIRRAGSSALSTIVSHDRRNVLTASSVALNGAALDAKWGKAAQKSGYAPQECPVLERKFGEPVSLSDGLDFRSPDGPMVLGGSDVGYIHFGVVQRNIFSAVHLALAICPSERGLGLSLVEYRDSVLPGQSKHKEVAYAGTFSDVSQQLAQRYPSMCAKMRLHQEQCDLRTSLAAPVIADEVAPDKKTKQAAGPDLN